MRIRIIPALLIAIIFSSCATQVSFPRARTELPKESSPTAASYCLQKGRAAESMGDLAAAYYWYWRGTGSRDEFGRFTGPRYSEPEESARFLSIVSFARLCEKIAAAGYYNTPAGNQISAACWNAWNTAQSVIREKNVKSYNGFSVAQLDGIIEESNRKMDAYVQAGMHATRMQRQAQMDNLTAIGNAADQITAVANQQSANNMAQLRQMSNSPKGGTPGGVGLTPAQQKMLREYAPGSAAANRGTYYSGGPGDIRNSSGPYQNLNLHDTYVEAAKAYRAAAAKLPGDQVARRNEYLREAAQMDAQARALEGR